MMKVRKSQVHRTVILIISVCLISFPAQAQYGGGTGEPNDPYLIYTPEHMNEIGLHEEDWDKHFALVTDVDLSDYPGTLFNKIGVYVKAGSSGNRPFTGKFDGQDHTIRHFTWTALEGKHSTTGLFVHLGSLGIIENLRLEHIDVNVPEGGRIGGLVGYNIEGEIRNCSVTGRVTSWQGNYIGGLVGENYRGSISTCSAVVDVSGVSYVGGLVGKSAHGEISKSHAHGQVQGGSYIGGLAGQIAAHGPVSDCNATGEVFADSGYVGGLIGYVEEYGTISGCHATGSVFAGRNCVGGLVGRGSGQTEISYSYAIGDVHTDARYAGGLLGYGGGTIDNAYYIGSISAGGDYVGGLVGLYKGTITNTYAQGSVSYPGEHVGGLVGKNEGTIMNCYAVVESSRLKNRGGLVRTNNGLVVDCFWDKEASGVSYSDAGEGKTTAGMMDPNTFIPWACSAPGVWTIDAHGDYPRLAWEGLPGEAIAPPAEPGGYYDGGTGEPNDPYRIATPLHLWRIGMYPCDWDKHFILVADVNLASHDYEDKPFRTIGWRKDQDHPRLRSFGGVFDGNSHSISHFFWPSTSRRLYAGLFGWLGDMGKITNLRMDNVFIERHFSGSHVGGLVGFSNGTIQSCRVTGEVGGNYQVGGLVGLNYGGEIIDCSSAAYIFGDRRVGGLVGHNKGKGKIHRSFVTGRVFARPDGIGGTGGLVGLMGNGEVIDCYARGDVEGDKKVGGLLGRCVGATIRRSYATGKVTGNEAVGGLVGARQKCTAEACFWDIETSGLDTSAGGTGLTTAEMQTFGIFLDVGWDFVDETENGTEDIWFMPDNDYPDLTWERMVWFPDYMPLDPSEHGIKMFEWVYGNTGEYTRRIGESETLPYLSGPITGVQIIENNNTLVGTNDGLNVRFLTSGEWILSTDPNLTAHPTAWSFAELYDDMIINQGTWYLVKRDMSEWETVDDQQLLIDIQDVTVPEGHHIDAVVIWQLHTAYSFVPLDFHGKEFDLDIMLPSSSQAAGYAVTGFDIFAVNTGLIAQGDIDAATGSLNNLAVLKQVE